ncbi:hypothetical protein SGFS_038180 [Streptomyces graminofaciens]|uniref:Peptidase S8/S53 domain-containing protein n=1 Tax=Streptomyces graminofaciens TaxID=68212 RepID=A0ABN5VGQ1_9ACTN|nr:type VII secretion-associated serine protease mycosin [Streptomyces graminofaciens]BBC32524.1 hypothetical protein SGFS_038180 [Streptomyces graminofaciens]
MLTSSKRTLRPVSMVSAALGLLLVGIAATPAHAESVRAQQWHLDAMHAEEMWKVSTGRGITVAVIDTGVDSSLADLKGQVLDGKDYSGLDGDEHTDVDGHGTSMAALIAATGGRGSLNGSYGLAPGAKILPIRLALNNGISFDNYQSGAKYAAQVATSIRFAADSEAQIINISGGSFKKEADTPGLASAVKYALQKGKLIFAAAGNEGDQANLPGYPASVPGVVAVGAINEKVQRSTFSEWGPQIDVTAPGENMYHACAGGTEICKSEGTSDATAIASASAALIWSKHPDWSNNQVLRVLINTMKGNEEGWTHNDSFGYGVVRPRVALKNPGDPGPADEYPLPDLAAAASASPSPEDSKPSSASGKNQKGKASEAASGSSASGEDNASVVLVAGISAAILLSAAIAVVVIRARGRRRAHTAALPPSTYPPQQLPSPASPQGPYTSGAFHQPPPGHPQPGNTYNSDHSA